MFNVSPSDVHANSYLNRRIQGVGVDGPPPPGVFDLLQYLVFDLSQQDEVYFMGGGAARGL